MSEKIHKRHKYEEGKVVKKCTRCVTWKTLDNYCKNKNKSDGLEAGCKKCRLEYYKKQKVAILNKSKELYIKKQQQRINARLLKMANDLKDLTYKEIPDNPGYYCTDDGLIYSSTFYKWLKPRKNKQGYCKTIIKGKGFLVHRLVALTFIENPNNLPIVNHKDGCKSNNNKTNLEWATQQDNCKHYVEKVKSGEMIKTQQKKRNNCPNINLDNFKVIEGFENYMIDKQSNIYSKSKKIILNQTLNNGYYYRVNLCKNNKDKEYKILSVHRLVALAFLENPQNKKFVNHKDGDKSNNSLSNLEWVTSSENQQHAVKTGLLKVKGKNINVINQKTNEIVNTFTSIKEAAIFYKTRENCVSDVCRGINNTWNGLIFKYA